jgi:nucleotide-binding universal stress UspA family protein
MTHAVSPYRRALVPLDGSRLAEGIIPFILDLGGPLGMEIVLLRVVSPTLSQVGDGPFIFDDMASRMTEARDYLESVAAKVVRRGMRVETIVRGGIPATEILAAVREVSAGLIAMTTHGRSGFSRLVFGSVAEAVLRQAEFPVFLVRLTADAHTKAASEALR